MCEWTPVKRDVFPQVLSAYYLRSTKREWTHLKRDVRPHVWSDYHLRSAKRGTRALHLYTHTRTLTSIFVHTHIELYM